MGLLEWVLRAVDRKKAVDELSEFLACLKQVDGSTHGVVAMQAADIAARLYDDTGGQVDLRRPRSVMASHPALLTELTETVIQLQKAGRQFEVPGVAVWVATLRAVLLPELTPQVTEMWSLITRGGRSFGDAWGSAALFQGQAAHLNHYNYLFRWPPEGFNEWANESAPTEEHIKTDKPLETTAKGAKDWPDWYEREFEKMAAEAKDPHHALHYRPARDRPR